MMTTYVLPLLAVVLLCAFWAVFQVWLSRHDPDARKRSLKCGGCGRQDECDGDADHKQANSPITDRGDQATLARH